MKILGLLANGVLSVYVLPEKESMTKARYAWLVEHRMAEWKADAFGDDRDVFLVQDHERALWGEEPKEIRCARTGSASSRTSRSVRRILLRSLTR